MGTDAHKTPSVQKSLDEFAQLRMENNSQREFYASLVRISKVAHGDMEAASRHIIVRAQMLQSLPRKLRNDAGKQQYLSGLDKENLLTLLSRVYDAEMKEEVEQKSYEPVCRVQGEMYKSTESRVRDLETENTKLKEDVNEIKGMVKELLKQGTQSNSGDRPRTYNQRRGPPPPLDTVRCYRCQEMGHYARDCSKPQVCSLCKKGGHSYASCPQNPKNE